MAAPSALCGSPVYMAPEVVAADGAHLRTRRFAPYDGRAADAWSAGVTLFEAAFGAPPLRPPAKALDPLAEMAALHAAWVRPCLTPSTLKHYFSSQGAGIAGGDGGAACGLGAPPPPSLKRGERTLFARPDSLTDMHSGGACMPQTP